MTTAIQRLSRFHASTAEGRERLWKVWWLAGIPVGWTASVLVIVAEELRGVGFEGSGDVLDVVRFLIYFAWCRLAWRCSANVEGRFWTAVARVALAGGLVFMAMF